MGVESDKLQKVPGAQVASLAHNAPDLATQAPAPSHHSMPSQRPGFSAETTLVQVPSGSDALHVWQRPAHAASQQKPRLPASGTQLPLGQSAGSSHAVPPAIVPQRSRLTHTWSAAQPSPGWLPVSAEQTPEAHDSQMPSQASGQHLPSGHAPLAHCSPVPQVAPFAAAHAPATLHTRPPVQVSTAPAGTGSQRPVASHA